MEQHHFKGRYTLGDKLQQQVAATDHSRWTGPATSCSNTLRRQVAATNPLVCIWECLSKSLSLQQNLSQQKVAQILSDLIFCDLLLRQNYVSETKIFTKILQHTRSDLLLLRVAATCRLVCTDLKGLWSFLSELLFLIHHIKTVPWLSPLPFN